LGDNKTNMPALSQLNHSSRPTWLRSRACLPITGGKPLDQFATKCDPVIPTGVNPCSCTSCREAVRRFTEWRNLSRFTPISGDSQPARELRFLIATPRKTKIAVTLSKQTSGSISNRNTFGHPTRMATLPALTKEGSEQSESKGTFPCTTALYRGLRTPIRSHNSPIATGILP
jgi:hypothetical protein